MAGGRPTDYNDEIVELAQYYLENYKEFGDVIPSVCGLCCVLKLGKTTIYRWKEEEGKERFRDILNAIIYTQENVTINQALAGNFNSNIAKLLLGKHGYHDKVQQDVTSSDGSMSPTRIQITGPDDSR